MGTPKRTPKRTRMSGEQRREQILDVAHRIIDAEGFHAATPNRIAEEAGVTRPVLYQQFGDLAGVFVALIDREADRAALQAARTMLAPAGDPFIAAFHGVLEAIDAHPATWRLFLVPPAGAPPQLHERLAQAQDAARTFLEHHLSLTFPGMPDPEYSARVIHAAGHELFRQRLLDPDDATPERLLALVQRLRDWVRPIAASSTPEQAQH